MAFAATAFASAGDAHAVAWMAVGRWTVLVFCAIVLARPLCAGLRALARLAVPALETNGTRYVGNAVAAGLDNVNRRYADWQDGTSGFRRYANEN